MRDSRFAFALLAVFALAVGAALPGCGSSGSDDDEEPFSHATHFAEFFAADPAPDVSNLNLECVACHTGETADVMETGHWLWAGTADDPSANIEGYETGLHGKVDLLNNFCIAIPSNEGRCTQCHIGIGWVDDTFDFDDPNGVDCLVCHDTTGLYGKHPTMSGGGGLPVKNIPSEWPGASTLLTPAEWEQIGANVGEPSRANCGFCHYKAGGGNNVKHGDLAVILNTCEKVDDVHMGSTATGGQNFACQECHVADADHGIGGMPIHHLDEGDMQGCADCHSGDNAPDHSAMSALLSSHVDLLACQVCHIPAIARHTKTKIWWDWSEANMQGTDSKYDLDNYIIYDRKKGEFIWEWDVAPALRRHNGKWNRMMVGVNDTYSAPMTIETQGPDAGLLVLASPAAAYDSNSKIYPFKRMLGAQPVDEVTPRVLVPHLFGTKGGPNPFWGVGWDWNLALIDGAAYTNLPYTSGDNGYVLTSMYLTVNHEVAPKEMALGYGNCCADCHGDEPQADIDWDALGRSDPWPNPDACD